MSTTVTDTTETLRASTAYWFSQFQLQQDTKDAALAQLRKLQAVIDDVKAMHRESKFMGTVSYCTLCTERWPCKSLAILNRFDNASDETVSEGATL